MLYKIKIYYIFTIIYVIIIKYIKGGIIYG
nr:MAG TPA: hypothetical protein [Caudoviricetes sp.]